MMTKKEQTKGVEKVAMASEDIENDNLGKLRSIFPQFVKEGQIDFDAFQAFLKKEGILAGEEKYGLSWSGKSNAFRVLRTPATGTLTPQPEESKDWDQTENIFIEGDNLEVLKLLQKRYRGMIKMAYIDPPYNRDKDFIYKDNFTQNVSDYYEQTGQTQGGVRMTTNTEKNGRYHSDWLTMMYPRLFLSRNLLKEDGVIFVSIDDKEVASLRLMMDEIFGEENFEGQIHWRRRHNQPNDPTKLIGLVAEHILVYAKNSELLKQFGVGKLGLTGVFSNPDNDSRGDWNSKPWKVGSNQNGSKYTITLPNNKTIDGEWMGEESTYKALLADNRIYFPRNGDFGLPRKKIFKSEREEAGQSATNWFEHQNFGNNQEASAEVAELFNGNKNIFDNPKPVKLLKKLISLGNVLDGEIILDFFAGSGTTAHATMELNAEDKENKKRKWLCVQLPEITEENSEAFKAGYKTIAEITRERIRKAGEKISEEVVQEKVPARRGLVDACGYSDGQVKELESDAVGDLDFGFKSYRLLPSNYRRWSALTSEDDEETLKKQTKLFIEKPLVDGYDEKSVVFEVMVKEGFDLNSEVELTAAGKLKLWKVTDADKRLFVTFAKKVEQEQVGELNLTDQDTFVCLDSALDDTTKVNLVRNFKVKVI